MKRTFFVSAAIAIAGATSAQELPVFDEGRGFSVIGVVDDVLIVENGGTSFACEGEEADDDSFIGLTLCVPILGPKAAAAAEKAAMEAAMEAEALLNALENLPPAYFFPAIEQTLRDLGCVIHAENDEERFVKALAPNVARNAGYTRSMSDELAEEVAEIAGNAGEDMVDAGLVTYDEVTEIVTLVDCN